MSTPGYCDLHIYRGDDFRAEFHFAGPRPNAWTDGAPINLTGWSFAAQWRSAPDSEESVDFSIDASFAASGEVAISLSESQTAALDRDGWFDLQAVKSGETRTWVHGRCLLTKDVTR
ncbi:hypothetical protein [Microbacterium sp. GXF6406]